jgi:thioredoxin-dependent peroxiredoxin
MPSKKKSRAKPKTRSKARPRTTARKKTARKTTVRKSAAKQPVRVKKSPAAGIPTKLPNFEVITTSGQRLRLSELKGKPLVLYFYPKDDTPGCTTEGCDIRDNWDAFLGLDVTVLGVSRDSLGSHEKFKEKFRFPFELVSDPDEALCRAFDVMRMKSLYGRTYLGVDRSTFIFDRDGRLHREYRSVKVPGHIAEVLQILKTMNR